MDNNLPPTSERAQAAETAAPPPLPPPPPPPIITVPPPLQPRPRRSVGWMIAALVLFCVLAVMLFTQFGAFLSGLAPGKMTFHRTSGPRLEEVIRKESSSRNKIAIIPVEGLIFSESLDGSGYGLAEVVEEQLKRAAEDSDVKAVLLRVDSPGGEVLAADEIYRAIVKFQKESKKPVVAAMANLGASGGYYVSAPCRWIVANELTITGSIGVIMHAYNYRGLMDKIGLRPEVFKSGKYKDMLSGDKKETEITPEEREMVQNLVNETYARFKQVIAEGRRFANDKNKSSAEPGRPLASNWTDSADGRILSGKEAHRLGFVDELGNFEVAVARTKKLANLAEATLVEYPQILDFTRFLRFFGKVESKSVKVELGMDLPKLKAGRLYFLAPAFLH